MPSVFCLALTCHLCFVCLALTALCFLSSLDMPSVFCVSLALTAFVFYLALTCHLFWADSNSQLDVKIQLTVWCIYLTLMCPVCPIFCVSLALTCPVFCISNTEMPSVLCVLLALIDVPAVYCLLFSLIRSASAASPDIYIYREDFDDLPPPPPPLPHATRKEGNWREVQRQTRRERMITRRRKRSRRLT